MIYLMHYNRNITDNLIFHFKTICESKYAVYIVILLLLI